MTQNPCSATRPEDYREVVRQIGRNHYFTNHGPLAKQFESELERFLGIENVVAVGSQDLALLIALSAMQLTNDLLVPAFRSEEVIQACRRLKVNWQYCDVDFTTHQISMDQLVDAVDESIEAVCLIETWGNRCDRDLIDWLGRRGKRVLIVASESFGSFSGQRYCCVDRHVVTAFGFSPGSILSTMEGGAIATQDSNLAECCRNIRSSYGTRSKMDVHATCNARFSEFQAGIGLKSLERLQATISNTRLISDHYSCVLSKVEGIEPYDFPTTDIPNHQCYPITVSDEYPLSAIELHETLQAMGFQTAVVKPSSTEFPCANLIANRLLLLPLSMAGSQGFQFSVADAIGELQRSIGRHG